MFFWKIMDRIEGFILVVGMLIMVFLNFANVVSRKLFPQTPFSYTEELIVIIFMWVTMFGISYAYRTNAHTALNILFEKLPKPLMKLVILFSALCSIALMAILIKTGMNMVINQITHGQVTPGMRLPMAINSFSIPFGCVLSIVSILRTTVVEYKLVDAAEAVEGGERL